MPAESIYINRSSALFLLFVLAATSSRVLSCLRPVKFGKQHQSAPSIYCAALVALQLEGNEPLHFLNVGSGTGYLQAIVVHTLAEGSVVHGIELDDDLFEQSQDR